MSRRRPRNGLRERWVRIVYADRDIGDACRVLLLWLAESMTDAGRVSVPRDDLADQLRIHPRRVTERITEATRAGLLVKCGGGYNGWTAQYEALLKVAAERPPSGRKGGGISSTKFRHLQPGESDAKVAAERPPIARVTNASCERDDNKRDPRTDQLKRRSDEEVAADSPIAAVLRLDRPQSGASA